MLLIYPKTYNATVTVLPPEKQDDMGGLSSLLSGQGFSGLLTGGFSNASAGKIT